MSAATDIIGEANRVVSKVLPCPPQIITKIPKILDTAVGFLESVFAHASTWTLPNQVQVTKEELIIQNNNELKLIREYRAAISAHNKRLTEEFIGTILTAYSHNETPLQPAHQNQPQQTQTYPLKTKKKSFFSKR